MKTLRFFFLTSWLLAVGAWAADGTLVNGNRFFIAGTGWTDAPVFDEDGTTRVEGPAFVGQLYVAAQAAGPLQPVDVPEPFGTGLRAGYVTQKVVTLPGIPGGTRVYVELRAWELSAGGTYELALANGGRTGASPMINLVCGAEPPSLPPSLIGIRSFSLRRVQGARIVTPPVPQTVAVGARATLNVVAEGTAPLTYAWFKNGGPVPGATGPNLVFEHATLADSGSYLVRVTNPWKTAESPAVALAVLTPPGLASQPPPRSVVQGGTLVLEVTATGSGPFQYQWRRDGADLPGATQPSLSIPDFTPAGTGNYTVVIRNAVGFFESGPIPVTIAYTLEVTLLPGGTVSREPDAPAYPAGSVVRLTPRAEAGFQFTGWGGDVSSTDNPLDLTLNANRSLWAGFTPVNGTVNFDNYVATAGVNAPVLDEDGTTRLAGDDYRAQLYGGASAEALQPTGRAVGFGTGAGAGYFTSEHSLIRAVPPVPLSGVAFVQVRAWEAAAGATYEAARLAGGKTGTSVVVRVVTGGGGAPPAFPANLVGLLSFAIRSGTAPMITKQPAGGTFVAGQPAALLVEAVGTEPLEYQWFHGTAEVAGATEPTLAFAAIDPAQAGEYRVRVRNAWGEVTSDPALVTVLVPPQITDLDLEVPVLHGGTVQLVVTATGSAPLAYAWFAGVSGDITHPVGTGQPTLTLADVLAPAAYWVRVQNAAGAVASETVNVTVLRHPQTIAFAALPNRTFGEPAFPLLATATSGLPVDLAVTAGPASLVGSVLTLTGAGTVEVTATQPGNVRFLPAAPVVRSFVVAKATATIALSDLVQVYNRSPRVVTATPTPSGLPVTVTYNGSATPPVNAGTFAISATINHANYTGAASGTLVVGKATQAVTFDPLPTPVFGGAPFTVTASASSGLPVSLTVVSGPATLNGGVLTATGAGMLTLRASQAGNFNYQPAQAEASLAIGKGAAQITLDGLTHTYDDTGKSARVTTQPAGLAVVVTYDGAAALPVEAGSHPVHAVLQDPNYEGVADGVLVILARVRGVVFEDADGNSQRGGAEAALPGVTVRLFEADGTTEVGTTTSAADGTFEFTHLGPRAFVVEETDPEGFASTTPNQRIVSLEGVSEVEVAFGDQRHSTVSGVVFYDGNGNGEQDPDEAGLEGVTVTLGTVPVRTTLTLADGSYGFANVPPGVFVVTETDLPGYTSTTPNERTVTLGAGAATARFGDRLAGMVSGAVFEDLDGDGQHGANEPFLGDVRLRLEGPDGARETRTDAAGQYAFTQLRPGTYEVEETDPAGFVSSTPNRRTVVITETASATASFGDQRLGGITGVVFDDANGNGQRDANEPGIGGVRVTLGGGGRPEVTVQTGADGGYRFDPAVPGLHSITETDPAGFVSTTPNLRQVNVGVLSAAVANFGDQAVGRVVGTVFNDLNGNGTQEPEEPGLGGVDVELIGPVSQRLTQTTGNGAYGFDAVEAGVYTVIETDPAGFTSSTPNDRQVVLAAGGSAAASFGDQQAGTVGGLVFDDRNGNGQFDPGEPGIAAVTVALSGGGRNDTTQTGGDGAYQFTGLAAGVYTLGETDPAGFASTSPNERVVSLAAGGAATVNFGDQPLQTIVGSVFEDQNGNGRHDAGEPGIAEVQVELLRAGSLEVLRTTVTSAGGGFTFTDVTPGDYLVRQVVPAGYTVATNGGPGLAGPRRHGDPGEQEVTLGDGDVAGVAFANLVIGSLTGVVFEDLDGAGTLDPGESGIGGVEVGLFAAGQPTAVATVFTAGNGTFIFTGLPVQDYEVRQTTPPGFFCAAPVATLTIRAGGAATARFANQRAGAVSGRVFQDENGNGAADPGEPGIGGVRLTLTGGDGFPLDTHSSGTGAFVFTGLIPGAYTLVETDPDGFSSSTPNEVAIALQPGQAGTASFGDLARPPAPPTLAITATAGQPGAVTVVLSGETGRTYTIDAADALGGVWTPLFTGKAVGGRLEASDPSPATRAVRFYRARFGE